MQTERRRQVATADLPVRDGIPGHGRIPPYYRVKVRLLEFIADLSVGTALPAEHELCQRFAASRAALRQAVGELVLEGRLRRRQGTGTYVARPKIAQPLALVSYTEGMRAAGITPGRSLITFERVAAAGQLAADLGVSAGDDLLHLERVLLADGERIGLESTYLPASRFGGLAGEFDPEQSLYAFLAGRFGLVFGEAQERVETVLATPREALLVGVNRALPMLLLHRHSWDSDGRPVERVRSLFRGDRFSFLTTLTAPARATAPADVPAAQRGTD